MPAIKGQPAPKPGGLADPVPGQQMSEDLSAALEEFSAPQVDAPAQEGPSAELTEALGQIEGASEGPSPEEIQAAIRGGMASATAPSEDAVPLGQQIQEFPLRARAGLAANNTEKLGFLRQELGENNVAMKGGEIYVRNPKTKEMELFDRNDKSEFLNDFVADWSREIVTELALAPAEAAGAVAGSTLGPGGAFAGGVSGRVLAIPQANAIADDVARWAGIPQDEARNIHVENLTGQVVEGLAPGAFKIAAKVAKPAAKYLPGTRAYREALEAGEQNLTALSRQSAEVAKSVEALNQIGRSARLDGAAIGVPGANVNLLGHQFNPDSPALAKLAAEAASDPRFINAQNRLAEDWGELATNTLEEIGRSGVKGPYDDRFLAERVTNAVSDLVRQEGKAVGKYKNKAMIRLGNKRDALPPEVVQEVGDLMGQFGFRDGKAPAKKEIDSLVGTLGTQSKGEVNAVVNNLEKLRQAMKNGATIDDLDKFRSNIGELSQRTRGTLRSRMGALAGDLRQTYRNRISSGLDDAVEKAEFNSTMDRFSELKSNVAVLQRALDGDASAKAIVRTFFTGKDNLKKIRAIKKISPESFANLRQEFVDQMLVDFSDRGTATGLKSGQLLNTLNKKYGKEFLDEVFDKNAEVGIKELKQMLTVTERIEKTFKGVKYETASESVKKSMMDIFIGGVMDIKFKTMNGVSAFVRGRLPKDHAIYEIMTREGFEKYIQNYPGQIDKRSMYRKAADFLAHSKMYQAGFAGAKEGAKRATRAGVRKKMQESEE